MANRVELRDIRKSFGGVRALRGVSLELAAGEVHALVGENGAGKSTLGKIIAGIVQADGGDLRVDGQPIENLTPPLARRLGIAAVQQRPALIGDLSVAENIALALERPGPWRLIRWRHRIETARRLLAVVGGDVDPHALARDLSMPQQQLVEVAKVLGSDARIVVFDEPTSSLGDREVELLMRSIRAMRERGVAIVYVSHRLDELFRIADRVTVLRDGEKVATNSMAEIDRTCLIRNMVGREVAQFYPKRAVAIGEPVLELHGIRCKTVGIADVDLVVRAGEIVGVAGIVGAGRTELASILFGIVKPDNGTVTIRGQRVRLESPTRALERGLALVPEDRRRHGIVAEMTLVDNIALAASRERGRSFWLDVAAEADLANRFVRKFDIKPPSIHAEVGTLSGGNQQKVALARMLATGPRVVVLDEPTQGVDVGAKAEIHRLMVELAAAGAGILMISSELPELLGMSDRIAVMRGGRLVGALDIAEATQENLLALALGAARPAA